MINAILGMSAGGWVALISFGYLGVLFGFAILALILDAWYGDWGMLKKDFGFTLKLISWTFFGLALGMFIFGNLLNFLTEGQFAIQFFNHNKVGGILLITSIISYFIGKELVRDREMERAQKENEEKQKHKYVTLASGKRVQIK